MWDADRAGPSVVVAPAVVWRPKGMARVHARGSLGACLFPSLGLGFPFCTTGLLTPHQKVARKESERGQGSSPGAHLGSGCMWCGAPGCTHLRPSPLPSLVLLLLLLLLQRHPTALSCTCSARRLGTESPALLRAAGPGETIQGRPGFWALEPPLQAPCCWAAFGQPGSFSLPGVLLPTAGLGLDSWPCP